MSQNIFLNDRAATGLPPYRIWRSADVREVQRLVRQKVARREIADRFTCSVGAINGLMHRLKHGLPVGPKAKLARSWPVKSGG